MSQPDIAGNEPSVRPVRVLIADDRPLIRKAVRATLAIYPHIEVVGEAQDGAEAIEEAKKLKPDVIVLNVTMAVKNGFGAAREIKTVRSNYRPWQAFLNAFGNSENVFSR
jgi:DNA-binding NarL/FixJ family response regulator